MRTERRANLLHHHNGSSDQSYQNLSLLDARASGASVAGWARHIEPHVMSWSGPVKSDTEEDCLFSKLCGHADGWVVEADPAAPLHLQRFKNKPANCCTLDNRRLTATIYRRHEVLALLMNTPRNHHYVPQFYLRNFACDPEKKKIRTLAKSGEYAVWAERSIEGLGYERDLYVHSYRGVPVSVEDLINHSIETPISKSDTWDKISSGRTDALDRSDKPILYALVRHLEARTPHYLATQIELAELAAQPDSNIPFTDEERAYYAELRANAALRKEMFNYMSASIDWDEATYRGAGVTVVRTANALRSSTIPVLPVRAPEHPALRMPLPGMVPFTYNLTLNPTTMVNLVLADFDDAFLNVEQGDDFRLGVNRHLAGQFGHFPHVRHMITDAGDELVRDMTWAHYYLEKVDDRRMVFRRPADWASGVAKARR